MNTLIRRFATSNTRFVNLCGNIVPVNNIKVIDIDYREHMRATNIILHTKNNEKIILNTFLAYNGEVDGLYHLDFVKKELNKIKDELNELTKEENE